MIMEKKMTENNIYESGQTQMYFMATDEDFTRGQRLEEGRVHYLR